MEHRVMSSSTHSMPIGSNISMGASASNYLRNASPRTGPNKTKTSYTTNLGAHQPSHKKGSNSNMSSGQQKSGLGGTVSKNSHRSHASSNLLVDFDGGSALQNKLKGSSLIKVDSKTSQLLMVKNSAPPVPQFDSS
jgi:hypothetical protein